MATFDVAVSFHFDDEFKVEADSYEEAERLALELAEQWKPYSSEQGVTYDWYSVDIESVYTPEDLEEEDE
jgi:hypothetical protein